jgi:DNA-binding NarL/FixJ family response regulator
METKKYIKFYQDRNWLVTEYLTLGKSSKEIAKDLHISYKLVEIWLKNFDIPIRVSFS